jgi:hypothetical protein
LTALLNCASSALIAASSLLLARAVPTATQLATAIATKMIGADLFIMFPTPSS